MIDVHFCLKKPSNTLKILLKASHSYCCGIRSFSAPRHAHNQTELSEATHQLPEVDNFLSTKRNTTSHLREYHFG